MILALIPIILFFLVILPGLVIASRAHNRTRRYQTLARRRAHIAQLERELGMGFKEPEFQPLPEADRDHVTLRNEIGWAIPRLMLPTTAEAVSTVGRSMSKTMALLQGQITEHEQKIEALKHPTHHIGDRRTDAQGVEWEVTEVDSMGGAVEKQVKPNWRTKGYL